MKGEILGLRKEVIGPWKGMKSDLTDRKKINCKKKAKQCEILKS